MSIRTQYFALQGGLDLNTPAVLIPAGRAIAGVNYEPHPRGYQRVDGFERVGGIVFKPSLASYWILRFADGNTPITSQQQIVGATSGAKGWTLVDAVLESGSYGNGDAAGYFVFQFLDAAGFEDQEDLELISAPGVPVAQARGTEINRGATNDEDDQAWLIESIEFERESISPLIGNGPVLGVWVYKDKIYAFRDSLSGTFSTMFESSPTGWKPVVPGMELSFDVGTVEISEGETLTGSVSGATGTVKRVVLESGDWNSEVWAEVGNRLGVASFTIASGIAALNETTLILANGTTDRLVAYQWDGLDWRAVGNPGTISGAGSTAIAALNGSDFAFIDASNDELRAYRWDGEDFSLLGSGLPITSASTPAITALTESDIAFVDGTIDELRVYHFDGTNWALTGNGLSITPVGTPAIAALNSTDVAFIDNANGELRTYRFDGSDWAQVGNGLSLGSIGAPALTALNETDVVIIDATNEDLQAYRWNGSDWLEIASSLSVPAVVNPALTALNSSDVVFIDTANDQLRTYRFLGAEIAKGRLILHDVSGDFVAGELITDGKGGAAVATSDAKQILLPPGGSYEFVNHNFFGAADLIRMYGVNGEGFGFEFDGEVFVPINTGMEDDRPIRVDVHRNHLFFAYRGGSLQHSSTGNPYQWQVLTGAAEIGIGEEITDLIASVSGAMVVLGRNKVSVLLGDDAQNWVLRDLSASSGGVARTGQMIGTPIYLDDRGLRSLETTEAFGDFRIGTITQSVEPIFRAKRKTGVTAVASMRVRAKDQYRLFWSDGTGLTVYFGRQPAEAMVFDMGFPVSCAYSGNGPDGQEILLFGDDDGMVYEMDSGTSFDGQPIEAFLRLPFNHVGSPSQRKRWTKASLEMDGGPNTRLGLTAEFGYANPDQPPSRAQEFSVRGGGGFWNEMNWDEFYWSSPVEGQAEAPIDGLGSNISIAVVSDATYEQPHLIHGLILNFSYRGIVR